MKIKEKLFSHGFTQWRHDIGARRGEFSNSYRNENLNLNIILYSCTYDIRELSTGDLLVDKGDQFELLQAIENGQLQ